MSNTARDSLYETRIARPGDFKFDRQVASVFDDMIGRSVPLYREVQVLSAEIGRRYYKPGTSVYDLGCSTGTTLVQLCRAIGDENAEFVGVDNSEPMLERCREKLASYGFLERVKLKREDVAETAVKHASVVTANYTLQFLPPLHRLATLTKIRKGLVPGGICLVSEKVAHESDELHELMIDLHHDFKRENDYSELEISRKRQALENVLITLSLEENLALLRDAGFQKVEILVKWLNFVSFAAVV